MEQHTPHSTPVWLSAPQQHHVQVLSTQALLSPAASSLPAPGTKECIRSKATGPTRGEHWADATHTCDGLYMASTHHTPTLLQAESVLGRLTSRTTRIGVKSIGRSYSRRIRAAMQHVQCCCRGVHAQGMTENQQCEALTLCVYAMCARLAGVTNQPHAKHKSGVSYPVLAGGRGRPLCSPPPLLDSKMYLLENQVEAGKDPKILWGKVHACVCMHAWCASSCAHATPPDPPHHAGARSAPAMSSQPPPPAACHVSVTSRSSFMHMPPTQRGRHPTAATASTQWFQGPFSRMRGRSCMLSQQGRQPQEQPPHRHPPICDTGWPLMVLTPRHSARQL